MDEAVREDPIVVGEFVKVVFPFGVSIPIALVLVVKIDPFPRIKGEAQGVWGFVDIRIAFFVRGDDGAGSYVNRAGGKRDIYGVAPAVFALRKIEEIDPSPSRQAKKPLPLPWEEGWSDEKRGPQHEFGVEVCKILIVWEFHEKRSKRRQAIPTMDEEKVIHIRGETVTEIDPFPVCGNSILVE